MQKIKKNNFLILVLPIFMVSPRVYGMEMEDADPNEFLGTPILHTPLAESLSFINLSFECREHLAGQLFKKEQLVDIPKALHSMSSLNKELNALINTPDYVRRIIKDISKESRLFSSNQEIAEQLKTRGTKKILDIQNKAFALCTPRVCASIKQLITLRLSSTSPSAMEHWDPNRLCCEGTFLGLCFTAEEWEEAIKDKIDINESLQVYTLRKLCEQGTDLEFTYNKKNHIRHGTLFRALCSTSARAENDRGLREIMRFFISQHKDGWVDLNAIGPDGKNGFMQAWCKPATDWVGQYFFRTNNDRRSDFNGAEDDIKLIQINQQDNEGNTALMHYLLTQNIHLQDMTIENFIKAGADPKLGNHAGLTPLKRLEQLQSQANGLPICDLDYVKELIDKIEKKEPQQQKD